MVMRLVLLHLLLLLFSGVLSKGRTAELLTSAAAIRALTPEQVLQRLPVRLDGGAAFCHGDRGVLFIHDGQETICVGIAGELRPAKPYAPGTLLHIEGVAGPGAFLPVVWPSVIRAGDGNQWTSRRAAG